MQLRNKRSLALDLHNPRGQEVIRKLTKMAGALVAKASWEAANARIQFHGGFGFAHEYDIERKFGETRMYQVVQISTNLPPPYVVEHIPGLPRSF